MLSLYYSILQNGSQWIAESVHRSFMSCFQVSIWEHHVLFLNTSQSKLSFISQCVELTFRIRIPWTFKCGLIRLILHWTTSCRIKNETKSYGNFLKMKICIWNERKAQIWWKTEREISAYLVENINCTSKVFEVCMELRNYYGKTMFFIRPLHFPKSARELFYPW